MDGNDEHPGAAEIDLAMERGEVQCRAGSLEGYFGSEPTRSARSSSTARAIPASEASRDRRRDLKPPVR